MSAHVDREGRRKRRGSRKKGSRSSLSFNVCLKDGKSVLEVAPDGNGAISLHVRDANLAKAPLPVASSGGAAAEEEEEEGRGRHTRVAHPAKALEAVKALSFDCLKYSPEQLIELVELSFEAQGFLDDLHVPRRVLHRFLHQVRRFYNPNDYHNFHHCFDVYQAMLFLLEHAEIAKKLDQTERFCLLVAALVHDMDHPGTNNAFQVATSSALAMTYNDISVLENHHLSLAFRLLAEPHCDITRGMDKAMRKTVRSTIIDLVLATDMSKHRAILEAFCAAFDAPGGAQAEEGGELGAPLKKNLMQIMLKMSDVNNVSRPFKIADKWAKMVQDEFYSQGDTEKALGLPVMQRFDRGKSDEEPYSNGTLEFVQYVTQEFYDKTTARLTGTREMFDNVQANKARWERRRDRHASSSPSL